MYEPHLSNHEVSHNKRHLAYITLSYDKDLSSRSICRHEISKDLQHKEEWFNIVLHITLQTFLVTETGKCCHKSTYSSLKDGLNFSLTGPPAPSRSTSGKRHA